MPDFLFFFFFLKKADFLYCDQRMQRVVLGHERTRSKLRPRGMEVLPFVSCDLFATLQAILNLNHAVFGDAFVKPTLQMPVE